MERIRPRVSAKRYTSHVSAALTAPVLVEVDRRAAAAGLYRSQYVGRLVVARSAELDDIARRVVPLTTHNGAGPRQTIAATVGAEVHDRIKAVAACHGVAVGRLVALVVDDELAR